VTPREFFGNVLGAATDMWIPITMQAQANPGRDYLKDASTSWLLILGRLRTGVSLAQAEAAVANTGPTAEILRSHKTKDRAQKQAN